MLGLLGVSTKDLEFESRLDPLIFPLYVGMCLRALVLHARMLMLVLQNERGNTRLRSHRGPTRQRRRSREEERIEEANSTGQAASSSAGPALGPTGGPGVTFQDGCA
jgi:hypothetical protein